MGGGRKTQTISAHEYTLWSTMPDNGSLSARKLQKGDLGGVIFGCTNDTMTECLSKQLFGLPYAHICYVQNIGIGLPVFLFNYSDRKLHGIYEAASLGQTNHDASAWTGSGSLRSLFPAQVRIRTMTQCEALAEKQFKKAIEKNYFTTHHFWFELDIAQTRRLMALFKPSPSSSTVPPVGSKEGCFPVLAANRSVALGKRRGLETACNPSPSSSMSPPVGSRAEIFPELAANKSVAVSKRSRLVASFNPSTSSSTAPPVGSKEELFPELVATKSAALCKKERPRATQLTYRDAVSQVRPNN